MLTLDESSCFEAVRRRDARFDGRFYTGVTSTGIFCRPSCPARTPKRANVVFFVHPAAALDQGFRACRRCRPELSPGNPEWNRRDDLAAKAVAAIERGEMEQLGVDGLACSLGVSARHLRRELRAAVGTTPQHLASTRRIWLARLLLEQTELPVADVAFAAGFSSVRRFNEVFRSSFERTPTDFRAHAPRRRTGSNDQSGPANSQDAGSSDAQTISLCLPSRGELGWNSLLQFFAARAIEGLEVVSDNTYTRHTPGGSVTLGGASDDRQLNVSCKVDKIDRISRLLPVVRSVVDLDSDTAAIAEHFKSDRHLAPLLDRGVPPLPGTFDGFEIAVRAVVGQQISVRAAQTFLARILQACRTASADRSLQSAQMPVAYERFPKAVELLAADLSQVGLTKRRVEVLRSLATAVEEGKVDLDQRGESEETSQQLLAVPGIGPWTAGYIAMRALGDPNGWPENDLVVHQVTGLSEAELKSASLGWQPWRAYAALLAWSKQKGQRK